MPARQKQSYASRVRARGRARQLQAYDKPFGYGYNDMRNFVAKGAVAAGAAAAEKVASTLTSRRKFAGTKSTKKKRLAAPSGQMTFVTKKGGRFRSMTVPKLLSLGVQKRILRMQGVNRMGGWLTRTAADQDVNILGGAGVNPLQGTTEFPLPGFYGMYNSPNAVGTQSFPLYVADLTCFANSGVLTNVLWRMTVDDAGSVGWTAVGAQNTSGAGTQATASAGNNVWYVEDGVTSGITLNNFKYVQHDYFDIRACAYGARQQPTFYDFMIVRFEHDHLCPSTQSSPTRSFEEGYAYRALWQGLVKNLSYNTILPGTPGAFKGMKVLRRFRFTLPASDNDNSDKTPNWKVVKFFYKDYKIRDYAYGPEPLATDAAVNGADYVQQQNDATDYNNEPKAKARLFLIVRASNTVPQATTGADDGVDYDDCDVTPSFDLFIRKQIRHQSR